MFTVDVKQQSNKVGHTGVRGGCGRAMELGYYVPGRPSNWDNTMVRA